MKLMNQKNIRDGNIAYTEEYAAICAELDYLFEEKYFVGTERHTFFGGRYLLITNTYTDRTEEHVLSVQRLLLYRGQELLFEQKSVCHKGFHQFIEHQNGRKYLLFSIDLCGYSIINLESLQVYHYVPAESFRGAETFIWASSNYSGDNMLAVEGYYFDSPCAFEIYDFDSPEDLPYRRILKSGDIEPGRQSELSAVGWITDRQFAYFEYKGNEKIYKVYHFNEERKKTGR